MSAQNLSTKQKSAEKQEFTSEKGILLESEAMQGQDSVIQSSCWSPTPNQSNL